jgi:methionine aminopeptidase
VDGLEIEKGVSFPVCISVNEVICNHSPLPSEELVSSFESEKIST